MKYGISSSALFGRLETNESLEFLKKAGNCECVEVFFQCPDEYSGQYRQAVIDAARGLNVISMHMLSTSFEGLLFSRSRHGLEYAQRETFDAIHTGHELGAKYYVFHGRNRILSAKDGRPTNAQEVATAIQPVIDELAKYDMKLALEDVFWSEFSAPEFGYEIVKYAPEVVFTLDTKQAVRSKHDYHEYLASMGERLSHIHVYDFDENGRECLPGKGTFDFARFGDELREHGYKGDIIIEAYQYMYKEKEELLDALEYLKRTMGR